MIKVHKNIAEAVLFNLKQIFEEGKYADHVVEKTLKQNPKWGSRDRRFIAESTYDIVRWWRLLCFTAAKEMEDFPVKEVFASWLLRNQIEIPQWLNIEISLNQYNQRLEEANATRKIRESIPDWLDEAGISELGSLWDRELKALNEPAKVVLRVNTLKTDLNTLSAQLFAEGITTQQDPNYPNALILEKRTNIFNLPLYKEGYFEIQDASSQLVAPFLHAEPGMTVIDACAGAGGKTLHIASLIKNKGRLIAMDIEEHKLTELTNRAKRAGINSINTIAIKGNSNILALNATADRLLLDVPCSGLGVLKRNPDAKWKLNSDFINRIKITQGQILDNYSLMLKKSGKLVYATCSIFPSENENQVKRMLDNSKEKFFLEEEAKIMPSKGFDGFYMARLAKTS